MKLAGKLIKVLILMVNPPQEFRDRLRPPANENKWKWYLLTLKRFFDTGLAITNYLKYIIAIFGFTSNDVRTTMLLAGGYSIFCVILGYWWFIYGLVELENEIGNRFNFFIQEMRDMKKKVEK